MKCCYWGKDHHKSLKQFVSDVLEVFGDIIGFTYNIAPPASIKIMFRTASKKFMFLD
jgi:hypothetical protein